MRIRGKNKIEKVKLEGDKVISIKPEMKISPKVVEEIPKPVKKKWWKSIFTFGILAISLQANAQFITPDQDTATVKVSDITATTPLDIDIAEISTTDTQKVSLEGFNPSFYTNQLPVADLRLEIPAGNIVGKSGVNKYGRANDGVQTTLTDIWDRADASATQQIWLAPTAARVHKIASSSSTDDGTPEGAGAGAQAIRVWGLTGWGADEVSEDVILNGTDSVDTGNSYVIIHRMKVIPVGSTYRRNTGIITAKAVTDNTITAQISATEGQTNMAIYGIPSTKTAYMTYFELNAHLRANPGTASEVDFTMVINERPDLNTTSTGFINKSNKGTNSAGASDVIRTFNPYFKITGPAIIKFQGVASAADIEGTVEFDLILIDN